MLLPVLGLTWIIGIIAVNNETQVFAWIFAILNSLQVYNTNPTFIRKLDEFSEKSDLKIKILRFKQALIIVVCMQYVASMLTVSCIA